MMKILAVLLLSNLGLLAAEVKAPDPAKPSQKSSPITDKMLADYWHLTAISISLQAQAQENTTQRGNLLTTANKACTEAKLDFSINPQTNAPECIEKPKVEAKKPEKKEP